MCARCGGERRGGKRPRVSGENGVSSQGVELFTTVVALVRTLVLASLTNYTSGGMSCNASARGLAGDTMYGMGSFDASRACDSRFSIRARVKGMGVSVDTGIRLPSYGAVSMIRIRGVPCATGLGRGMLGTCFRRSRVCCCSGRR